MNLSYSLFCCLSLFLVYNGLAQKKEQFQGYPVEDYFMESLGGVLHYQSVGNKQKPTLILIHGSPGDLSAWDKLLHTSTVLNRYFVILIDRPSYGKTTWDGGSLSDQSKQLSAFMDQHCRPCGLVGHSYGGALALQLAVDYPLQVKTVVSIAGTIAAPFQKARWYNYIAKYAPMRWLLPKDFKASNKEMWSLEEDLIALEKDLPGLNIPVILYQGGKDILVNSQSAAYIDALLPESKMIFRPEKNHFVIWTDLSDLEELFLDLKIEH